jgi:serine/threonine protein kinase
VYSLNVDVSVVSNVLTGSGAFGSVFLCHHVLDDIFLGTFAVKIVPVGYTCAPALLRSHVLLALSYMVSRFPFHISCSDNRAWLVRTLREVRALQRLHHPHIVQYQHAWLEYHKSGDFGPVVPSLFILMEFANGGNLADLIAERIKAGSCLDEEEELWPFLIDIALGIRHLHRAGVIHRYIECSVSRSIAFLV